MKLFRSSNINVIDECRLSFNFMLPSEKIEKRRIGFEGKFSNCTSLLYYFNICPQLSYYVNAVTVDYLLSCLVKLVKIYSFYSFFSILPVILIPVNKRLSLGKAIRTCIFLLMINSVHDSK